jgi:hypothetical protein
MLYKKVMEPVLFYQNMESILLQLCTDQFSRYSCFELNTFVWETLDIMEVQTFFLGTCPGSSLMEWILQSPHFLNKDVCL